MDSLASVFARNCTVRRIDKNLARSFLEANHRFGDASCRYRYGMFIDRTTGKSELSLPAGTLVAVSEFSSARKILSDGCIVRSYEWIRYASLSGLRVVGGMSKMLSTFVGQVHPDDVMSYAPSDCPDGGDAYSVLGFESEGDVVRPGFVNRKFRKRFVY